MYDGSLIATLSELCSAIGVLGSIQLTVKKGWFLNSIRTFRNKNRCADMMELADMPGLGSGDLIQSWGFKSLYPYWNLEVVQSLGL